MASWDVFHNDRLEMERGLSTAEVRAALARGALTPDDLGRPAGSSDPWTRLGDLSGLSKAEPKPAPPPAPKAKAEPKPVPPAETKAKAEPKPAPPPAAKAETPAAPKPKAKPAEPPKPAEAPKPVAKPQLPPERDPPTYAGAPPAAFFLGEETAAPASETFDAIILPDDDEDIDKPAAAGETFEAVLLPEDDDEDDDDVRHVEVPVLIVPSAHSREEFGDFDLRGDDRPDRLKLGDEDSSVEIAAWDDGLDDYDPQEEDEAAAEFTLSRSEPDHVEELDLAAMVDVAFQLVLFFLVTATTVLYKSLEIPKPNPESNAAAAASQGRPKTLDELKETFILVEIDPNGAVKIDSEPVRADLNILIERLRAAREQTDRRAMLLTADFATPHRSAVLAYDAANEIGLSIAIARPNKAPDAPAPATPKAGG